MAEKQDDGENDPLNGSRGYHGGLRASMAPEHVRDVEDRWLARRTGIDNSKQCLQVPVKVTGGDDLSTEQQEIIACVPPIMNDARWKSRGAAGRNNNSVLADLCSERSCLYRALFPLMKMDVEWRTVLPSW